MPLQLTTRGSVELVPDESQAPALPSIRSAPGGAASIRPIGQQPRGCRASSSEVSGQRTSSSTVSGVASSSE
eukprot:5114667-Alexandrium_andersonii.AAC.1